MIYYTYLHSNYGYFLSFFTIFPLGIKYIYWRYWLKNNNNNSKMIKTIRDPLIEAYFRQLFITRRKMKTNRKSMAMKKSDVSQIRRRQRA